MKNVYNFTSLLMKTTYLGIIKFIYFILITNYQKEYC